MKHGTMHLHLLEKVKEMKKELKEGKMHYSAVYIYLFDYVVVSHLLKEDVKFFSYIDGKGM